MTFFVVMCLCLFWILWFCDKKCEIKIWNVKMLKEPMGLYPEDLFSHAAMKKNTSPSVSGRRGHQRWPMTFQGRFCSPLCCLWGDKEMGGQRPYGAMMSLKTNLLSLPLFKGFRLLGGEKSCWCQVTDNEWLSDRWPALESGLQLFSQRKGAWWVWWRLSGGYRTFSWLQN